MTEENISFIVKSVLINNFNIESHDFSWDKPLEQLQENFKILGYLVFLEQLLNREFNSKIVLLEHISSNVHTPKDIVELIQKELQTQ
jgi:hypothetical protein